MMKKLVIAIVLFSLAGSVVAPPLLAHSSTSLEMSVHASSANDTFRYCSRIARWSKPLGLACIVGHAGWDAAEELSKWFGFYELWKLLKPSSTEHPTT